MKPILISTLIVFTGFTLVAHGAEQVDTAAIAPFVNENTVAVIRADLTNIDFGAVRKWAEQALMPQGLADSERARAAIGQAVIQAMGIINEFTRAGGKTVWIVFTVEHPNHLGFVVVPLDWSGGDVAAVKGLMARVAGTEPKQILQVHGALVVTPDPAVIARLVPTARPELTRALGAAGEGKLQVALVPSDAARKVLESMLPQLPGGEPASVLTRGIVWASIAAQPPPDAAARILIQSQDAQSAQALQAFLNKLAGFAHANNGSPSELHKELLSGAAELASAAVVKGDQISIDLNKRQSSTLAADLAQLASRQRERSSRLVSASHMRQILIGCFMYANNHKGEFPDTLEQALQAVDGGPDLLVDPRRPDLKIGYVYIKPPAVPSPGIEHPASPLMLYEKLDRFGEGVNVGFADGHVEWFADEQQFTKLLHEAEHPAVEPTSKEK